MDGKKNINMNSEVNGEEEQRVRSRRNQEPPERFRAVREPESGTWFRAVLSGPFRCSIQLAERRFRYGRSRVVPSGAELRFVVSSPLMSLMIGFERSGT